LVWYPVDCGDCDAGEEVLPHGAIASLVDPPWACHLPPPSNKRMHQSGRGHRLSWNNYSLA
jgi:hypothetical protein